MEKSYSKLFTRFPSSGRCCSYNKITFAESAVNSARNNVSARTNEQKHANDVLALIAGKAKMEVIEQHWDEVLRLKASIGADLVPPSVILKKLAASPRQNRLNLALREMGRIERSIFICDWLLDTRLRRRSHAILNKGESRHALARAIFLHQLGEFRNRAAETMAHRASGLNLVVNAIILWNTVYLSRAVDYIRSQGIIIPEELLSSVSPLPWGHISLTGDYLWNEIDHPLERYRPLRSNRFNPKNFTFP